jgi:hypothetical protein
MFGSHTKFGRVLWTTQHSMRFSNGFADTVSKSDVRDASSHTLNGVTGAAAMDSGIVTSENSADRNAA